MKTEISNKIKVHKCIINKILQAIRPECKNENTGFLLFYTSTDFPGQVWDKLIFAPNVDEAIKKQAKQDALEGPEDYPIIRKITSIRELPNLLAEDFMSFYEKYGTPTLSNIW